MKQHITVKLHSLIDLITNSSTEIFVHSDDSIEPAKDLLNEFLKLNGSNQKWDEVFEISLVEDETTILDYMEYRLDDDMEEFNKIFPDDIFNKEIALAYISDVFKGIIETPDWWLDEFDIQTFLKIKCKDSKYDHFLELLDKFLYSPSYFEHSSD